MKVFILATCRKSELLEYTTLVFKTLRVGFPTADIFVHVPGGNFYGDIEFAARNCKVMMTGCKPTIHHDWINGLLESEREPFWICDTDQIFFGPVEGLKTDKPMMGRLIPEFQDEVSGCITRSRLHTSLLWLHPGRIHEVADKWAVEPPTTPFTPHANLVSPLVVPLNGGGVFYDTCSMLYHACGGAAFTDTQNDQFEHLHMGTWFDMAAPRIPNAAEMKSVREAIIKNPSLAVGLWRHQAEWYAARQPQAKHRNQIETVSSADAVEARKWNEMLCCGNKDAMYCCDLAYRYFHGIDDILDTMEDGRPTLSKEEVLSVFFSGLMFFNCPFFRRYQEFLFPTVALVHNQFCDSVAWEKSPLYRRRVIADVLRTCGDEFYNAVALVVPGGGEAHMRKMSQLIRERDWINQHDKNDKPT